ncbi:hypothetical protein PVV74_11565 [Roseovarius sp. SK2]|uniref:hypothetical protein n=1 Tax=Roseovarius TaxID=74030 RepID=UPI00237BABE2|nr:hypothetical protein [Roseovarius sp. SK2]MDD9726094.1 hypothetical protein [Roseovarius sp. SK2]
MQTYDAWKLASPDDERHEVGTEDGQPCLRYHEPDEDAPRGYKPKPCPGVMEPHLDCRTGETWIECDTCGETP